MAAPNFTLLRGGQINQSGDDRAIFLKKFGGEVFTAYDESNVFGARTYTRTIAGGKSAAFPIVGGLTAEYHTPGQMIVGAPGNLNEVILTIDQFLFSASAIAEIDVAMTHFDYRSPFTREQGRAIARQYDANIARCGIQAALTSTSPLAAGDPYVEKTKGYVTNEANAATDVAALKAAMLRVAVNFDEKDVPDEDRNMFIKPALYALVAADPETVSDDMGAAANQIDLKVAKLYGFNLVKSNNLPTTAVTGTYGDKYNVDARNAVALIMRPRAVGTLKVRDLSVSMTGQEYLTTHNATLVKSQLLCGHGKLLSQEAAFIRTATPA